MNQPMHVMRDFGWETRRHLLCRFRQKASRHRARFIFWARLPPIARQEILRFSFKKTW